MDEMGGGLNLSLEHFQRALQLLTVCESLRDRVHGLDKTVRTQLAEALGECLSFTAPPPSAHCRYCREDDGSSEGQKEHFRHAVLALQLRSLSVERTRALRAFASMHRPGATRQLLRARLSSVADEVDEAVGEAVGVSGGDDNSRDAAPVLRGVHASLDSLVDNVVELVYDTMFEPLRSQLGDLATWGVWAQQPSQQQGGVLDLPSFSLPPSERITHVGEHLLNLVQQLEPLLRRERANSVGAEDGDGDGVDGAAAAAVSSGEHGLSFWMSRMATGVTQLLLVQVSSIERLTAHGCAQLSTDLDYLGNVLRALGVGVDPLLVDLGVALSASEQDLRKDGMLVFDRARKEQGLAPPEADEVKKTQRRVSMLRKVLQSRRCNATL